ncbi:MAG TPA: peroxidase-related enzyme [Longimicrobiales bacterium]
MPVHSGTHPVAHSRRLHLPAVEENLQPGVYRRLVENARARNVEYSKIWELFAFQERFTIHLARFTEGVLRTPTSISPGLRELIAAYTSHLNECRFCTEAHAAAAAELLGSEELVRSVLADLDSAPLHAREKALLRFAAKVTTNLPAVTGQDVEELRACGWDDEAIYYAITTCALFNFYNRWITATGVPEMSREAHRLQGRMLAHRGYLREKEQ